MCENTTLTNQVQQKNNKLIFDDLNSNLLLQSTLEYFSSQCQK